jgi:hypothetical protein
MSSPPNLTLIPILTANTSPHLLTAMQTTLSTYQTQHANYPQHPVLIDLLDRAISDINAAQNAYQVSLPIPINIPECDNDVVPSTA